MKKIIAIISAIALVFTFAVNVFADSTLVMPRYNNAVNARSSFSIDGSGTASISTSYSGYSGVTQGASITVKLEKRFLFAFWNDVDEWSASSSNVSDTFQFTESVGKGTYRATIELQVYGSGGATDVITEELEYKY